MHYFGTFDFNINCFLIVIIENIIVTHCWIYYFDLFDFDINYYYRFFVVLVLLCWGNKLKNSKANFVFGIIREEVLDCLLNMPLKNSHYNSEKIKL